MADKSEDFVDYIDSLKRKEQLQKKEALAATLRQEWRETTWAGALIASVEGLGIANFFQAIGESFAEGEDSTSFYLTGILYKIGVITASTLSVYVLGWIVRQITGDEIVVEQEVVIVEEITRSQVESEERAAPSIRRGKKKKSQ